METKFDIKLKRILIIAILCVIAFLPSKVSATIVDGVEYSIYNDGSDTMYVSGCDLELSSAIIQSQVNGRKVIAIGNSAFENCSNLSSIIIPTGIEKIGDSAFYGCSKLINITLPDGLKKIGLKTFKNCTNLKEIDIPDSVTEIATVGGWNVLTHQDGSTFENCTNLQRVKLSANMTGIPSRAFYGCENLTDVTVPDSITTIFYRAFYGCSGLKKIETSKNTECIYGGAFEGCTNLKYVKIPSKTNFSEKTTIGSNYQWPVFKDCPNLILDVVQDSPAEIYAINNNINYTIYAYPIKVVSVNKVQDYTYTGYEIKPDIIVKHNEELLNEGKDYILTYSNNKNVGTAGIIIQGIGKYEGIISTSFKIVAKDIKNTTINKVESQQYTGLSIEPNITVKDESSILEEYKDYTVSYENNKNVGMATIIVTGVGNYKGSKTVDFTITKATYDMSNVKFKDMTVIYDGKPHSITATGLPNGLGVKYTNNVKTNVGTYLITAQFIGDMNNYEPIPNMTAVLKINAKRISENIQLKITSYTYDGKEKKPDVIITDLNGKTIGESNYIVEYSSNQKVGTGTATIILKGNYEGTKKISFKINPKGTSIKKLKAGKKQIKATWNKQKTETTGYQIQYSTNKKFKSGNKKVKIKKNKITSSTIKKLKAKKKYYVRIRTYKKVNGKTYYSGWSKVKNVTTKK